MDKDLTPERAARNQAKAKVDELNSLWLKANLADRLKLWPKLAEAYDLWERTLLAAVDAVSPNPSVKRIIYKGRGEEPHGPIHRDRISHRRRRSAHKRRKAR